MHSRNPIRKYGTGSFPAFPHLFEENKFSFINESRFLHKWCISRSMGAITFSVSPKLSISGEKWEDAIRPEIVYEYSQVGHVYLKFVVATKEDVEEAQEAVNEYTKRGFRGHVYLMPCGGVEKLYTLNARNVANEAMRLGWRYSDRLQVPLFKNEWGT